MENKEAGLLLHITSIPSQHGIGDLGAAMDTLLPFLQATNHKLWQVLPIHPVGFGDSPYQGLSVFAGNEWLISPEMLWKSHGIKGDQNSCPNFSNTQVDFLAVREWKETLYKEAFRVFSRDKKAEALEAYDAFVETNRHWLKDYCLFRVIKEQQGGKPWHQWPVALRNRNKSALATVTETHENDLSYVAFLQHTFFQQWHIIHKAFKAAKIDIIGDLPIFVAHDSADVWANQELFQLDRKGAPTVIAGVPPDYFSPTGQRWGNPHYRWDLMKKNDFCWWKQRIGHVMTLVDRIRIDHFRGFEAFWEVKATETTATRGQWVKAPGEDLFTSLKEQFGELPFIAEDLGVITPEVRALKKRFGFPGMKILQFGLSPKVQKKERPPDYEENTYAYTGTHDNDTLQGWLINRGFTDPGIFNILCHYYHIRKTDTPEKACQVLIERLLKTNAGHVIIPLQDYYFLGNESRMNYPGTVGGRNWKWRAESDHFKNQDKMQWIGKMIDNSGR